ncbi:MAG TPA: MFS transporter [Xanthobacteraceae bacterium]|nr:MFS transporter [Xanthobacteraceae bacterium]
MRQLSDNGGASEGTIDAALRSAGDTVGAAAQAVEQAAGGPARLRVTLLLAAVLGLDAADKAAMAAVAGPLKTAFHIGNPEIGYLIAAVSLAGAVFTLPIGILVDRVHRQRILLVAIVTWTAAMAVSGTATSFIYLIITRAFLGAVTAAAAPTVASLVGDFFPAQARARLYGVILGGELVGVGIGFFISGEVSSFADWHWSLWVMSIPGAAVAFAVWRYLPEPARGGQSWIRLGQEEVRSLADVEGEDEEDAAVDCDEEDEPAPPSAQAHRKIREAHIRPRRGLVLQEDPTDWSLWRAVRYLLRIPSFRLLVVASALGYYFFAGVRAFGMIYLTGHYELSRSLVSALSIVLGIGGFIGLWCGAQLSTRLLERGWISARIIVGGGALLLAAIFTAPAIWTRNPFLGVALLTLGTAALAAANPPIDAARLDVMHPRLWGRAESTRMALRALLEAVAPVLFGWLSVELASGDTGLEWTFLIMLLPVVAASLLAIPARRAYPRDVATADASSHAVSAGGAAGLSR